MNLRDSADDHLGWKREWQALEVISGRGLSWLLPSGMSLWQFSSAGEELSYRELRRRADLVASEIGEIVSAGQLVGIFLENPVERIIAMFGVLKAGGIYWVIPPGMSDEVREARMEAEGVAGMIHDTGIERRGWGRFSGEGEGMAAVYSTSGSTGVAKMFRRTHEQILGRIHLYGSEGGPLTSIEALADYYSELIVREFGEATVQLCGYSFAGIIAFEIARSGRGSCEAVSLLDTSLVGRLHLGRGRVGVVRRMRRLLFRQMNRLKAGWAEGVCRGMAWAGREYPERYRSRYFHRISAKARDRYEAGEYAGEVRYFGGTGFDGEGSLRRIEGWKRVCSGRLIVEEVDASHQDLIKAPAVHLVAERLRELNQLQ